MLTYSTGVAWQVEELSAKLKASTQAHKAATVCFHAVALDVGEGVAEEVGVVLLSGGSGSLDPVQNARGVRVVEASCELTDALREQLVQCAEVPPWSRLTDSDILTEPD